MAPAQRSPFAPRQALTTLASHIPPPSLPQDHPHAPTPRKLWLPLTATHSHRRRRPPSPRAAPPAAASSATRAPAACAPNASRSRSQRRRRRAGATKPEPAAAAAPPPAAPSPSPPPAAAPVAAAPAAEPRPSLPRPLTSRSPRRPPRPRLRRRRRAPRPCRQSPPRRRRRHHRRRRSRGRCARPRTRRRRTSRPRRCRRTPPAAGRATGRLASSASVQVRIFLLRRAPLLGPAPVLLRLQGAGEAAAHQGQPDHRPFEARVDVIERSGGGFDFGGRATGARPPCTIPLSLSRSRGGRRRCASAARPPGGGVWAGRGACSGVAPQCARRRPAGVARRRHDVSVGALPPSNDSVGGVRRGSAVMTGRAARVACQRRAAAHAQDVWRA